MSRSMLRTAAILYLIVFTNGNEVEEYGCSMADVRDFCDRHYRGQTVEYITAR